MSKQNLLEDKRILIVDDESDVLETLESLLSMCKTATASSFDEAKRFLETEYFDLAILDIMGVKGYDLLEIAKERDVIPVMLTAHALSPEDVVRSYKNGAAFYVPKDKMAEIEDFLNDILEARKRKADILGRGGLKGSVTFFLRDLDPHGKAMTANFGRIFPNMVSIDYMDLSRGQMIGFSVNRKRNHEISRVRPGFSAQLFQKDGFGQGRVSNRLNIFKINGTWASFGSALLVKFFNKKTLSDRSHQPNYIRQIRFSW